MRKPLVLPLFCLCLLGAGLAQERFGSMGTVTDPTGGVTPAARIVATSPATPQPLETASEVVQVATASVLLQTTSRRTATNIAAQDFQHLAEGRLPCSLYTRHDTFGRKDRENI